MVLWEVLGLIGLVCAIWVIYDVIVNQKSFRKGEKVLLIVLAVLFSILTAIIYYLLVKNIRRSTKEKKEKRRWGLILFIVIIMLGTTFSFVYYGFSGVDETVKYNGIKFVKFPDRWEANINGATAAFTFLPGEVENVFVPDGFSARMQDKLEIDATYDANSTFRESIALAQHQMGLTLEQYNIFVRKGFTANNSFNLPVITCNDSTANVPVVYFRHGNSTGIHLEKDCIIAEAQSNTDFIKAKDRLLYGILGVIK